MQEQERSVALAALAEDLLQGKISKTDYAQKRKELEAGSQKADLFPAPERAVFSKENYALWKDYALGCTRLIVASVYGEASAEVATEIDHFKKVADHELSFKGRGGFLTRLLEAFVHADLQNSAAMLSLMRYLEDKYRMEEGRGK